MDRLERYDPTRRQLRSRSLTVLHGRRRSGKGTLAADLLFYARHSVDYVFSDDSQHRLPEGFVPDRRQHGMSDGTWLADLCAHFPQASDDPTQIPHVSVVHYPGQPGVSQLLLGAAPSWTLQVQTIAQLNVQLRHSIDVLFLCHHPVYHSDLGKLHRAFFADLLDFRTLEALLAEVCQDYRSLVLDRSRRDDPRLFWYKADPSLRSDPRWLVGERVLWPFHRRYCSPSPECDLDQVSDLELYRLCRSQFCNTDLLAKDWLKRHGPALASRVLDATGLCPDVALLIADYLRPDFDQRPRPPQRSDAGLFLYRSNMRNA